MKILVIEDDPEIVEVVSLALHIRWPEAQIVSTHLGERGIEMVEEEAPEVVILDLGLPDISGYDVLKRVRLFSDVFVIILTSRDDEADIVKGLEWGADDFICKPFRQLELISRMQALFRRSPFTGAPVQQYEEDFLVGDFSIDYNNRVVKRGGEPVKLTPTEYQLLYHLTKNCGRILSSRTLLSKVWGQEYKEEKEYLKVHIRNLRQKLGDDTPEGSFIVNERGIGYKFVLPEV